MEGRREDSLPVKTPESGFKLRALDTDEKSCAVDYDEIGVAPQENDIKDFYEDGVIKKKRYTGGVWVETGIEWEI